MHSFHKNKHAHATQIESDSSSHLLDDACNNNCGLIASQELMDHEETASFQSEDLFLFYFNKKIKNSNDNVSNVIKCHATNQGARKTQAKRRHSIL